jgi:predicted anti-sigma-YlaC factor YlaD
MPQDVFKPLLMGYLDAELTEVEIARVERHLKDCAECNSELEEFRRLKEVTQNMSVVAPDDRYWEEYWSNIYNRLERRIGWILTSIGVILLTSYGVYWLVLQLFNTNIPLIVQIGLMALVVGFCTLLVSVLRERLSLSRSDKYERIKR